MAYLVLPLLLLTVPTFFSWRQQWHTLFYLCYPGLFQPFFHGGNNGIPCFTSVTRDCSNLFSHEGKKMLPF